MKKLLGHNYFKDKVILLMGFVLGLLTLFNILSVLLRTDNTQSSTILRYWTVQGAAEFEKQSPEQLYAFALFALIAMAIGLYVSYKSYDIYKPAAYASYLLAHLVVLTNILVSGAILNLQQ